MCQRSPLERATERPSNGADGTAATLGGWVDRVVQFVSVLGTAVPAFIIAIILVFGFAITWRLLPATGYVTVVQNPSKWAKSLTLPVLALLIGSVASAAQQFRTAVLDTLGRDYVRTLRARGINEREIIFRNVLRNSAGATSSNIRCISRVFAVGVELPAASSSQTRSV